MSGVGFIGCGKMGGALASAFVASGALSASELLLHDKVEAVGRALAQATGGRWMSSARALCEQADVVFLAVKPQDMGTLLNAVGDAPVSIWVSIAAGVRMAAIRGAVADSAGVIRTMPNRPALVRAGVTALMGDDATSSAALSRVSALLESAGSTVTLTNEAHFDAVTALSGSGPAFVFRAIESLVDGGIRCGLSRKHATTLAVSTVYGAGKLLLDQGTSAADERVAVSSPGGTTLAGLAALESAGFYEAVVSAVEAAATRSRELGA